MPKRKYRRSIPNRYRFVLSMILAWVLGTYFFVFLRNYGWDFKIISQEVQGPGMLREAFFQITAAGLVAGTLFSLSEILLDRESIRRRSYGFIIIFKLGIYFLLTVLSLLTFLTLQSFITYGQFDQSFVIQGLRSNAFFVVLVYTTLFATLLSFLRQVDQKFGPGMLWNLITGKYHRPREEQRIFMFIDLKSSTMIAEKIGHIQYSRLIQDCFYDITGVVVERDARIYQYVGDEVVLYWDLESGIANYNCIEAFFEYQQVLAQRAGYYEDRYGFVPVFKAGLHCGICTVAEVGVIKREIAFHGDVLNTAARIESKCNLHDQQLLTSEVLIDLLHGFPEERIVPMGEDLLRGKEESLRLYGIRKGKE